MRLSAHDYQTQQAMSGVKQDYAEVYLGVPRSWSDTNQILWQDGQPATQVRLTHAGPDFPQISVFNWPATSWPQPLPDGVWTWSV
jgi:hypothetical protein